MVERKENTPPHEEDLASSQELVMGRHALCRLIGVTYMPFVRTILLQGLYELKLTENGKVRISGEEITYLQSLVRQKRAAREISPSHRTKR
ncbi:MAG: hypothetical protein HYW45_02300 [Candidatus Daviesbacteria bacterium]|nr:MAG: hypothetical protein HYW45_02300 [Candidatus Daviesbacteria bacterium]